MELTITLYRAPLAWATIQEESRSDSDNDQYVLNSQVDPLQVMLTLPTSQAVNDMGRDHANCRRLHAQGG